MHLIINDEQDKHLLSKVLLHNIEKALKKLADMQNVSAEKEVGLIFVDDEIIQELNSKFRGKDAPTDVLSFPLSESEEMNPCCIDETLGDIYISVERAVQQAEEYGHSLDREVCFLALHGLLHLLGYDHKTTEDEEQMNANIEEVLGELNLSR